MYPNKYKWFNCFSIFHTNISKFIKNFNIVSKPILRFNLYRFILHIRLSLMPNQIIINPKTRKISNNPFILIII